jgi:Transglutaminase-like superfamily
MSRRIARLARHLTRGLDTDEARAVRLHDYVRDRIAFGFAPQLDAATPEQTLDAQVGHTIPKTTLFVALARAAGLRAFEHYVTIDHALLRGAFPHGAHRLLPWEIPHAYAEVEIDESWWRVDSYALDLPLWRGAVARLAREGDLLGYGAHCFGTCRWRGRGHAYAQLVTPDMVVEDHGAYADVRAFLAQQAGAQRSTVRGWHELFRFASPGLESASMQRVNAHLDRLRAPAPLLLDAAHA